MSTKNSTQADSPLTGNVSPADQETIQQEGHFMRKKRGSNSNSNYSSSGLP
ncbi:hypothetical protein ACFL2B_02425 [Patescibacteria group bacterium]